MFRSATFKLTMWYLAIVMAISLVFSAVLYHVATGELDRGLHNESLRISRQFPVFQGDPLLRPGQDYNSGAHRILWQLVSFNVIVLIGAGWASYWLARRTLRPIEEAHEQQKRFTADVSHELRTPLTALKMESEVALMNPKNGKKELRDTLASNLEEVTKLEDLINNLLRLTRLEAGELEQQFERLNSETVAQAAVEQVAKQAAERHITVASDLKPAELLGDQTSLTQLLVILLDNAIKYSPSGSTVQLSAKTADQKVVFEVADQGAGIEREALEHVFDRFYRGQNSSRTKSGVSGAEGYGLGLSIAKMIADVHKGTITISSRPGHGTTATVTLPLSPKAKTDENSLASGSAGRSGQQSGQQRADGQQERKSQQNN
ncbi:MAG TPA: HAMP domain-containing sensor histidine kinase [Candidatus Saccharimonadales bacterium]|nr:HAMP domain-containing sensor histidine kinase [Candidatus Saccharimonadales bacterium]